MSVEKFLSFTFNYGVTDLFQKHKPVIETRSLGYDELKMTLI